MNEMRKTGDGAECGGWRLGREIGRGAYGVVYAAENGGGERAAVKVCRRDDAGGERYGRELRGARLYSAIPPQEGLVRMRTLAEEPWGFYAVMDLADDEFGRAPSDGAPYSPKTLASVIEGEKALPLGECVRLGVALAKGLAALQRHHLLHRDIKPGNVIYVGGRPVLSDPGLVVEETEAASLVGTPGYVPPESFTDASSDIYSLGLTLKAASFGRRVEDLDKGPALEADTGAALFPAWWRILNKATDPTPSRRYQSAKALLRDLAALRIQAALPANMGSRLAMALLVAASVAVGALLAVHVLRSGEKTAPPDARTEAKAAGGDSAPSDVARTAPAEKPEASPAKKPEASPAKKPKAKKARSIGHDVLGSKWGRTWDKTNNFYAYRMSRIRNLHDMLERTKKTADDPGLAARAARAQKELSGMNAKLKRFFNRATELAATAKLKYAEGKDISDETKAMQQMSDEEDAIYERFNEIGESFYKNWEWE